MDILTATIENEVTTAIYDGKNGNVELFEKVNTDVPLSRNYVGSVFDAMETVGLPFVTGIDKVVLRAARRSAYDGQKRVTSTTKQTTTSDGCIVMCTKTDSLSSKSRKSIKLGKNLSGVLNVVRKYDYLDANGAQKVGYEYHVTDGNVSVYVSANSLNISVSKMYVYGMMWNGVCYRSLYSLFHGAIYHLMSIGVIAYRGKNVYSRSAWETARYNLKKFYPFSLEVCTLFNKELSRILFKDLKKSDVSSFENTIYFQSDTKRKVGEKMYLIADESNKDEVMLKHEVTVNSQNIKRCGVNLHTLKQITGNGNIPTGLESMIQKRLQKTVASSSKGKKIIMTATGAKEKNIGKRMTNVEFGMNYLMSTMSDMNRRIANIERDVKELKQNGINIKVLSKN